MDALTIDQQIECVNREIGMRRRVYPNWVSRGKMKQAEADYQIAAMQAVLKTLKEVKETSPGTQGALTL